MYVTVRINVSKFCKKLKKLELCPKRCHLLIFYLTYIRIISQMSTGDEGDVGAEGRTSVRSNASLISLMHEPDRLNVIGTTVHIS